MSSTVKNKCVAGAGCVACGGGRESTAVETRGDGVGATYSFNRGGGRRLCVQGDSVHFFSGSIKGQKKGQRDLLHALGSTIQATCNSILHASQRQRGAGSNGFRTRSTQLSTRTLAHTACKPTTRRDFQACSVFFSGNRISATGLNSATKRVCTYVRRSLETRGLDQPQNNSLPLTWGNRL